MAGGVDAPYQRHAGWHLLQRAAHLPGEEAQWPGASLLWLHHIRCGLTAMVKRDPSHHRSCCTLIWCHIVVFQSLPPISPWSLNQSRWRHSPLVWINMLCLPSHSLGRVTSWNGITLKWPLELTTLLKVSLKEQHMELLRYIVMFLAVANYCPPNNVPWTVTEPDMRRSLLWFLLQAHPLLSASPWWSTTTSL